MAMARYTPPEGIKGLIADGGTGRAAAVTKLIESTGGKVEAHYYAFGETDAFTVIDVPSDTVAASISLTVAASGLATLSMVQLLSPEDIDAAAKMSPLYDAPGPTA